MKRILILFILVTCFGIIRLKAQSRPTKAIVKFDPSLDEIIDPDAQLELIRNDFGITEGPNWIRKGSSGYLVFTDIAANVIYKMTPDGKATVFIDHAGYRGYDPWNAGTIVTNRRDPKDPLFRQFQEDGADGLSIDKQGRIISATLVGRSIERIEKNGKRTVLADHYQGKRLGGPNDVVVKRDGAIYYSDTTGGVRGPGHDPTEQVPDPGIYMIKDGKVTMVVSDIPTPNGLAFSADEKYLYANSGRTNTIRIYDVQSDDTVKNGRLLIDISADKAPGVTDGMRVDSKGNIYSSGPGGIWIISTAGKHLGTILFPDAPYTTATNMTFGDADGKTLYTAARSSIFKIRVKIPGNRIF